MHRKVLIVEDSGITRLQLCEMLRDYFSADVIETENGVEALSVLRDYPDMDLVLTDIEMPEMDGVELIRRIRASELFAFVPVLVFSCLDNIKQRSDALNAGADAFIEKPVTVEALRAILKDVW
jgi:CheY-like chemotaxis protein